MTLLRQSMVALGEPLSDYFETYSVKKRNVEYFVEVLNHHFDGYFRFEVEHNSQYSQITRIYENDSQAEYLNDPARVCDVFFIEREGGEFIKPNTIESNRDWCPNIIEMFEETRDLKSFPAVVFDDGGLGRVFV